MATLNNSVMEEAAQQLYILNSDQIAREKARAREDYIAHEKYMKEHMKEIEEKYEAIAKAYEEQVRINEEQARIISELCRRADNT